MTEPLPYARAGGLDSPLAQRLQDNLQAQLDCTQQLLDLLREERGALIGSDVAQLERLTTAKAEAAGRLQGLGTGLLQLRGNARIGIEAWIGGLRSQALIAQWRELLQRAERCRNDNDSNAALLASREAQLRDTLRALRPLDTAEVYGRRGSYQLGLPGRSFGTA